MMELATKRKAKNCTQQQLANAMGVTQTTISLIESHARKPSVTLAKRIAEYLEFSWTEFYEEEDA